MFLNESFKCLTLTATIGTGPRVCPDYGNVFTHLDVHRADAESAPTATVYLGYILNIQQTF